ncbi:thiamine pyrophosphate-dependent enzyme [Nocardia gipuzkoensis]
MTIVVGNPEFQAQTFALRDNCGRLARAVVENFDDIAAVTGKPVTHLVDLLAVSGARFHYAINEKVAFESAVGASMSGRRVCVVMKHNGLGCVADSLANAALHTVGAALVVIVGDDPDATSSTSAVDSRLLAEAVQVPMLEPTLSSDCAEIIATAVDTAERNHVPVLIRVTPQLHAACDGMPDAIIDLTHVSGRKIERHSRDHVAHSLTKLGRIQRHRLTTLPGVRATSDGTSSVISCDGRGSRAVIASGAAAQLVPSGGGCLMSVRRTWPLSSSITEFARAHDEVLVVEDSAPVLERFLRRTATETRVRGRLSGHLPPEGALCAEWVDSALAGYRARHVSAPQPKPIQPPPLSVYHPLFEAIGQIRRAGTFVATDVGSSVRLCYPPYSGADVALALGSAGAVAGGAAADGSATIAVTGDFALMHSGIEAVLEATDQGLPVVLVVLANGIQAQTGGQPVPRLDIARMLRGCGVAAIDEWDVADTDVAECSARLTKLLRLCAPAAAIVTCGKRPA